MSRRSFSPPWALVLAIDAAQSWAPHRKINQFLRGTERPCDGFKHRVLEGECHGQRSLLRYRRGDCGQFPRGCGRDYERNSQERNRELALTPCATLVWPGIAAGAFRLYLASWRAATSIGQDFDLDRDRDRSRCLQEVPQREVS